MKVFTLTALVTLSGLAAAQIDKIPTCALSCFQKAIMKTDCGLDTYCQCTDGSKVIQKSVISCLCSTEACDQAELKQMQDASNVACSSALAASSQTYSAATIPANVCATAGGSTSTGTGNAGTTTGTAAAASGSGSSSSSGNGAYPTAAPILGYECAALGLAGMAVFGF